MMGLATDGGYCFRGLPAGGAGGFAALVGMPFPELAVGVMHPYMGGDISLCSSFPELVERSSNFQSSRSDACGKGETVCS